MEDQQRNDFGPQAEEEPSLTLSDELRPAPDAIELLERSRAYLKQLVALAPSSRKLDPSELIQQLRSLE